MGSSGSYFKIDTQRSFDFKQFEEIVRREVRAVHVAWGQRMADGYNKIVADWSPKTRPHFQAITRYYRATGSVFVTVYIRGTPRQKMIFHNIDHGARRGQTVTAGAGYADAVTPDSQASVNPRATVMPNPPVGGAPFYSGAGPLPRGYRKQMALWKKHQKAMDRAQQQISSSAQRQKKRRPGPGRTRKGSRLGPTPYTPRTNKSGGYRGAGYSASANPPKSRGRGGSDSAWRGRGQPKKMKLKPIAARRYTVRLRWLIRGRSWPWAEEIWGPKQKMLHKNIVQQGYINAGRAIKKA